MTKHYPASRLDSRPQPRAAQEIFVSKGSLGAGAVGALALGALAIGAIAIGALAINRMRIRSARIERLSVGTLKVGRLVIREREDPDDEVFDDPEVRADAG